MTVRSAKTNFLNSSLAPATRDPDYSDERVGDIGQSAIKTITHLHYINDGADPDAHRINALNGGEAPLSILAPLAYRINAQQYFPATVSMSIPGIDNNIVKGRIVDPHVDGRDDVSVGIFKATGFTIAGSEGKHRTSLTARQVG